ncbi:MAG: MFS transporter [Candidatus Riflebacteria bacterium HGW-Riflebacteria-2]|jgi:OFA family oxalate/formate antiporter-like MFS transporter|nr:MAG: MFS transporter [Candidatus Riflebacteria bacterium HGW-Riflebacteria-2]
MSAEKIHNRWLIAIMGTLLQMCLGTVYAWSYFQKPLVEGFGWSNAAVAGAFSTAICFLGLAAAWGGMNLAKYGPTKLAMGGGALFGIGYLIGAYALNIQSIILLYIGYGAIGGAGLGLGYVTPVATCAKWFPDKKGFITGMVVMGFGLGALLMSKFFAPMLMNYTQGNVMMVFAYLGVIFLVLTVPIGSFMKNPPAGYVPEGFTPPAAPVSASGKAIEEVIHPTMTYIMSKKFIIMWLIFFCNITAGIAIIGFQSPLLQDLYIGSDAQYGVVKELKALASPTAEQKAQLDNLIKILAGFGATLIGITSLFNGLGRFFWGGLSDKIGRVQAFRLLVGTQILVFVALAYVGNPYLFGLLFCYILLCYGGGFGTMPSFVLDVYGAKMMPTVYGIILTAWSAGGIVGPQFVGIIKDKFPAQAPLYTFWAGAGILAVGLILSFLTGNEKFEAGDKPAEEAAQA